MSQISRERSDQTLDSPNNRGPITKLIKIATLAYQARSNPKFIEDHTFALKILRDARALIAPWLEEVEQELRYRGLLNGFEHRGWEPLGTKPQTDWIYLAVKLTALHWKASKAPSKAEEHEWKKEMLKEMFHHLKAHMAHLASEVKQLEEKAEANRQHRKKHRRSKHRTLHGDEAVNGIVDQSDHGVHNDRERPDSSRLGHFSQLENNSQESWNRNEDEHDPENHFNPVPPFAGPKSSQSERISRRAAKPGMPVHDSTERYAPANTVSHGKCQPFDGYTEHYDTQNYPKPEDPRSSADLTDSAPRSRSDFSQGKPSVPDSVRKMPSIQHGNMYQAVPLFHESSRLESAGHPGGKTKTSDGRDARSDARKNGRNSSNVQHRAPYDYRQTDPMSKAPSGLSESQYSRQTRAPTIRSAQSNLTSIRTSKASAHSIVRPRGPSRSPSDANLHPQFQTSISSSRVRDARSHSGTVETPKPGGHSQYDWTGSGRAIDQHSAQTDTADAGSLLEGRNQATPRNVPRTRTHSRGASQRMENSDRGSRRSHSHRNLSTHELQPTLSAAQSKSSWTGSLTESFVRPPSGKSCHAGSLVSSTSINHGLPNPGKELVRTQKSK